MKWWGADDPIFRGGCSWASHQHHQAPPISHNTNVWICVDWRGWEQRAYWWRGEILVGWVFFLSPLQECSGRLLTQIKLANHAGLCCWCCYSSSFSSLLCPLLHAAINATAAQLSAHTYVTDCETVTHTAGLGAERCSLLALKGLVFFQGFSLSASSLQHLFFFLTVCCLWRSIQSWHKFDFIFRSKSVLSLFEF